MCDWDIFNPYMLQTWASQFFPRLASPPCEERCRGKSWTPLPAPRSPEDYSFDSFWQLLTISFQFGDWHSGVVIGFLLGDGAWPHSWQSSLPSPAASPVPRGCKESPQFEPSPQSLSHAENTIYEEKIQIFFRIQTHIEISEGDSLHMRSSWLWRWQCFSIALKW